eukprot:gene178-313_t
MDKGIGTKEKTKRTRAVSKPPKKTRTPELTQEDKDRLKNQLHTNVTSVYKCIEKEWKKIQQNVSVDGELVNKKIKIKTVKIMEFSAETEDKNTTVSDFITKYRPTWNYIVLLAVEPILDELSALTIHHIDPPTFRSAFTIEAVFSMLNTTTNEGELAAVEVDYPKIYITMLVERVLSDWKRTDAKWFVQAVRITLSKIEGQLQRDHNVEFKLITASFPTSTRKAACTFHLLSTATIDFINSVMRIFFKYVVNNQIKYETDVPDFYAVVTPFWQGFFNLFFAEELQAHPFIILHLFASLPRKQYEIPTRFLHVLQSAEKDEKLIQGVMNFVRLAYHHDTDSANLLYEYATRESPKFRKAVLDEKHPFEPNENNLFMVRIYDNWYKNRTKIATCYNHEIRYNLMSDAKCTEAYIEFIAKTKKKADAKEVWPEGESSTDPTNYNLLHAKYALLSNKVNISKDFKIEQLLCNPTLHTTQTKDENEES